MNERYWKAIVRYGHLGNGREVSVARYICTEPNENILDAFTILENMPGTKNRAVHQIFEINTDTYLYGKDNEKENFYLKSLTTHQRLQKNNRARQSA